MAQTKAQDTGTYKVGDAYLKFREGDALPDGARYVDPRPAVKKQPEPENKKVPEPENKSGR